MGKVSLKAKNPFGADIEVFSTKTWIGLGAGAFIVAAFTGMVIFFKGKQTSGIQGLHQRLGDLG